MLSCRTQWVFNFFVFLMEDGETLMLVTARLLALQGRGSGLVHCRQGC
uniref:Uncharacterized protein n=1 Tax=Zea mays TaxID=4577 RepID=B4FXS3_MAIZE|nr:unknown [Zea mays]